MRIEVDLNQKKGTWMGEEMSLGLSRVERLSTVGTEVVGEKLLCES